MSRVVTCGDSSVGAFSLISASEIEVLATDSAEEFSDCKTAAASEASCEISCIANVSEALALQFAACCGDICT